MPSSISVKTAEALCFEMGGGLQDHFMPVIEQIRERKSDLLRRLQYKKQRRYSSILTILKEEATSMMANTERSPSPQEWMALLSELSNALYGFYPMDAQLLAVADLFGLHKFREGNGEQRGRRNRGTLLQILTGEGKTLVVTLVACLLVLCEGKRVDVMTSSELLAQRDSAKAGKMFEILNISFGHTGERNIQSLKEAYSKDVVYMTSENAQHDILFDNFMFDGRRGGRPFEAVIVDEVDNMFLDRAVHVCKISEPIRGLEDLLVLLLLIWKAVAPFLCARMDGQEHVFRKLDSFKEYLDDSEEHVILEAARSGRNTLMALAERADMPFISELHDRSNIIQGACPRADCLALGWEANSPLYLRRAGVRSEVVAEIAGKVRQLLAKNGSEEAAVTIPLHLKQQEEKIEAFVENAFWANTECIRNRHYIVSDKGQIILVDCDNTGDLQHSMVASGGVHQFLQMKENLRPMAPDMTCCFSSVFSLFRRYGEIRGVSGTLGSTAERRSLEKLYDVDCRDLPPSRTRRLVRCLPQVHGTHAKWVQAIREILTRESHRRPVVVICKYMEHADEIGASFSRAIVAKTKDEVSVVTEKKLEPGMVVVTTSLGGRGADFQCTEAANDAGGIFIMITFMPDNERVEHQAEGRTARNGNPGGSQLILCCDEMEEVPTELRELLERDKFFMYSTEMVIKLKRDRDEEERETLRSLERQQQIAAVDDLFVQKGLEILVSKRNERMKSHQFHMKALRSTWALFLDTVRFKQLLHSEEDVDKLTQQFREAIQPGGFSNPVFHLLLGHDFADSGRFEAAVFQYTLAVSMDTGPISLGAQVGKTYALLKQGRKKAALHAFSEAKRVLKQQIQQISIGCTLCVDNSELAQYFARRLEVLCALNADLEVAAKALPSLTSYGVQVKSLDKLFEQPVPTQHIAALHDIGVRGSTVLFESPSTWALAGVSLLSALQLAGGAFALTSGFPTIGLTLCADGIADICAVMKGHVTSSFSINDWAVEKAVSVSLSVASFGIGAWAAKGAVASSQLAGRQGLKMSGRAICGKIMTMASSAACSEGVNFLLHEGIRVLMRRIQDWLRGQVEMTIRTKLNGSEGAPIVEWCNMKGIQAVGNRARALMHHSKVSNAAHRVQQVFDKLTPNLSTLHSLQNFVKTGLQLVKAAENVAGMLDASCMLFKKLSHAANREVQKAARPASRRDTLRGGRADTDADTVNALAKLLSEIISASIASHLGNLLENFARPIALDSAHKAMEASATSIKNFLSELVSDNVPPLRRPLDPSQLVFQTENGYKTFREVQKLYGLNLQIVQRRDGSLWFQPPRYEDWVEASLHGRPAGLLESRAFAEKYLCDIEILDPNQCFRNVATVTPLSGARNQSMKIALQDGHFCPVVQTRDGRYVHLGLRQDGLPRNSCFAQTMVFSQLLRENRGVQEASRVAQDPVYVRAELKNIVGRMQRDESLRERYNNGEQGRYSNLIGGEADPRNFRKMPKEICTQLYTRPRSHTNRGTINEILDRISNLQGHGTEFDRALEETAEHSHGRVPLAGLVDICHDMPFSSLSQMVSALTTPAVYRNNPGVETSLPGMIERLGEASFAPDTARHLTEFAEIASENRGRHPDPVALRNVIHCLNADARNLHAGSPSLNRSIGARMDPQCRINSQGEPFIPDEANLAESFISFNAIAASLGIREVTFRQRPDGKAVSTSAVSAGQVPIHPDLRELICQAETPRQPHRYELPDDI